MNLQSKRLQITSSGNSVLPHFSGSLVPAMIAAALLGGLLGFLSLTAFQLYYEMPGLPSNNFQEPGERVYAAPLAENTARTLEHEVAEPKAPEFQPPEERPTSYHISCGTRDTYTIQECRQGSVVVREYVGDENLPKGQLYGKTDVHSVNGHLFGPLFHSERGSDRFFGYYLPVKPGNYFLQLHFLEPAAQNTGDRLMDIFVNNKKAFENFDVFAVHGLAAIPHSTVPTLVDCNGGVLNITFVNVVGNAMCSGFSVYPEGDGQALDPVQVMSRALPFKSFCSNYGSDEVELLGPTSKKVKLHNLGQMDEGPWFYSFKPSEPGVYKILEGGKEKRKILEFNLNPESCICPVSHEEFRAKYGCSEIEQLTAQSLFDKWKENRISLDDFTKAVTSVGETTNLTHVAIIKNELHVEGPHSKTADLDWEAFKDLLLTLLRVVTVEDVEFYWHSNRSPVLPFGKAIPPLLGPLYDPKFSDIPVPNKRAIKASFVRGGYMDSLSHPPWHSKLFKAYFRGIVLAGTEDNSSISTLFQLTAQSPELFNVGVSSSEAAERSKAFEHKIILELKDDQNLLTGPEILSSGSALVKQEQTSVEWYQLFLQENVHRLPVKESLEDVVKVVGELIRNPDILKEVAKSGIAFAKEYLSQEAILCWTEHVLQGLKGTLDFEPQIHSGMSINHQSGTPCTCV